MLAGNASSVFCDSALNEVLRRPEHILKIKKSGYQACTPSDCRHQSASDEHLMSKDNYNAWTARGVPSTYVSGTGQKMMSRVVVPSGLSTVSMLSSKVGAVIKPSPLSERDSVCPSERAVLATRANKKII